MQPYTIIAIIKEFSGEDKHHCLVVVRDAAQVYFTFVLPEDKPINKGQVLSFLLKRLKVSADQIIWPEKIEVPKI